MAVTTTAIAGTDSLSGSRITINDNFKTLEDALNSVLSAFDIVSGRFDNSGYGSANDILTNGLTINGNGLTDALLINAGDINLVSGNIKLSPTSHLLIGSLLELNQTNVPETVGPGDYPTWDLRDPGPTQDTVGGVILPKLSGAGFTAIGPTTSIPDGMLVFTDENPGGTAPLRIWWANGPAGPTWYKVEVTV